MISAGHFGSQRPRTRKAAGKLTASEKRRFEPSTAAQRIPIMWEAANDFCRSTITQVEKQLLARTHVLTLGSAVTVRGTVVDSSRATCSGRQGACRSNGEGGARETTNQSRWHFLYQRMCKPGQSVITAQAKGYAPTTLQADLTNNSPPIQITLRPGKRLELQVDRHEGKSSA